jgi:hypothetical protein
VHFYILSVYTFIVNILVYCFNPTDRGSVIYDSPFFIPKMLKKVLSTRLLIKFKSPPLHLLICFINNI